MQENHSQEAGHSAEILKVPQETIQATPQRAEQVARPPQHMEDAGRKPKVKWPKSSQATEWAAFEEDVDKMLEATLRGSVVEKI